MYAYSLLTFLILALSLPSLITAHGLMNDPNQRGALNGDIKIRRIVDPTAKIDYDMHFPAGDKNIASGSGKRSQIRAAGGKGSWTIFEPLNKNFRWRAGVCGDQIGEKQHHLKGGEFYHDAQIVRTYQQGSVIGVGVTVVANHNGFMQLHVCDPSKCSGGDINRECFHYACKELMRAPNAVCDSRYSKHCGPIDPVYPGRWYFPCTPVNEVVSYFDKQYIQYQLPEHMYCKHCVLQWYWASANTCNPPGVRDYFTGPQKPEWGSCPGQGDARGGFAHLQTPCLGADRFSEEYISCADITIEPRRTLTSKRGTIAPQQLTPRKATVVPAAPSPVAASSPAVQPVAKIQGVELSSVFESFDLWADGKLIKSISDRENVDISKYNEIAIEAVTNRKMKPLEFRLDDKLIWTDYVRPYFLFGNVGSRPLYWKNPPLNREIKLSVSSEGNVAEVRLTMLK